MAPARNILAANIKALRAHNPDLKGQRALAKKASIGEGSVWRATKGEVGVTLDTLEALAAVFGLAPWQLLVPHLDPNNPPVVQALSPEEKRIYELFKLAARPSKSR